MFKLNRIFWKVFAAVWMSNILILAATLLILNEARIDRQEKSRFESVFEKAIGRAVNAREQGVIGPFGRRPGMRPDMRRNMMDGPKKSKPAKFIILDDKGELFFASHRDIANKLPLESLPDHSVSKLARIGLHRFETKSNSGKRYFAYYQRPPKPKLFERVIKPFMSVQLLLMALASALMSGVISWRITQPLKRLGTFSRAYSVQVRAQQKMDQALLQRGDEIGKLAQDIEDMASRTQSAYNAQKDLLHDVSHELRAPLARLQVAASLVEQQYRTQEGNNQKGNNQKGSGQEYIDKINTECGRVDQLIQSILDYSRLDQEDTVSANFDFSGLVAGVVSDLQFEYSHREFNVSIQKDITYTGDESLLHRAFENVIRNACKYTPENTAIDIICKKLERSISLVIRDYGPGIRSHELETLFKPFYRSGNQMHTDGFGLGLSLVKRAIEKHGGGVELKNAEPSGLRVIVDLPPTL